MFTMFQVMTGESWAEMVARPIMDEYASAALYFVSYILVTSIVLVNVVIAVLLEKMVEQDEDDDDEDEDGGGGGALAPAGGADADIANDPSLAFLAEVEAATVPGAPPAAAPAAADAAHAATKKSHGHGHGGHATLDRELRDDLHRAVGLIMKLEERLVAMEDVVLRLRDDVDHVR